MYDVPKMQLSIAYASWFSSKSVSPHPFSPPDLFHLFQRVQYRLNANNVQICVHRLQRVIDMLSLLQGPSYLSDLACLELSTYS